ncbi:hypothetical protein NDU88_003113 [Pleurodeles waltl]|uniref:Uncharacterized protein n=1 Tax=Pleurodeles waltl TaxID=8319 RepID=A0AAV7RGH5_PLEWA|nr:hypothetical protein NDU88_003113 [Pleurodeles waltl]
MRRIRKTPGLVFESLDWGRSQDSRGPDTKTRTAGPGEHMSEPATPQEKRGQASTEATREDSLSIGSLHRSRESEAVKGVVPPMQGRGGGIRCWRAEEPARDLEDEQRRTRDEEDLEDARTRLRKPGLGPESGFPWTRHQDEDRGPRGAYE